MFVCIEMRKHGIVIKAPGRGGKVLPHCAQDSPVLGVTVYSHGYVCRGCQYAHLSTALVRRQCSCKGQKSHNIVSTPIQTIGRSENLQYFPLPGYMPSPPTEAAIVDNTNNNVTSTVALIHQHRETLLAQLPQPEDTAPDNLRTIHPCFINLSIHHFLEGLSKRKAGLLYSTIEISYLELSPKLMRLHSLGLATFKNDCNLCIPEKRSGAATVIAKKISHFSLEYVYHKLRCVMNTNIIAEKPSLNHLVMDL